MPPCLSPCTARPQPSQDEEAVLKVAKNMPSAAQSQPYRALFWKNANLQKRSAALQHHCTTAHLMDWPRGPQSSNSWGSAPMHVHGAPSPSGRPGGEIQDMRLQIAFRCHGVRTCDLGVLVNPPKTTTCPLQLADLIE